MGGDSAGYKAIQQQQARMRAQAQARNERRRERRDRRGPKDRPPDEPLVCPSCMRHFNLGDQCPDCEVWLVTASLAEEATPEPVHPPTDWPQVLRDVLLLTLVTAVGTFVCLYIFWGRWEHLLP